jgi:hypothetical protein
MQSSGGDETERLIHWTIKTIPELAADLNRLGHQTNALKVSEMLRNLGYSSHFSGKKMDKNNYSKYEQDFINNEKLLLQCLKNFLPAFTVDMKKKKNILDLKNIKNLHSMREEVKYSYSGNSGDLPKSARNALEMTLGMYMLPDRHEFINLDTDHEDAAFIVDSIFQWWIFKGLKTFKETKKMTIIVDAEETNKNSRKLWEAEIKKLACAYCSPCVVKFYPPGIRKIIKHKHRLFSFVSTNWKGEKLCDYMTHVSLIAKKYSDPPLSKSCIVNHRTSIRNG